MVQRFLFITSLELGELVLKTNQGVNTTTEKVKYNPSGDYMVIRSNNLSNNSINWVNVEFIDSITYDRLNKDVKPKINDVLYSNIGSALGYASVVFDTRDFVIAWNVFRIQPKVEIIEPSFLAYFLNYRRKEIRRLETQSTMPFINGKVMLNIPIPLPPLPEQQKIAEILSTVDEQISQTQAIIDKSKELKRGLMQKLFSEGIGHTEFKDTKIGQIPKGWEVYYLRDLCSLITDGSHYSPTPLKDYSGYLIATVKDVYNGILYLDKCANISQEDYKQLEHNNCVPAKNDVLLSKDGSVGRTCIWDNYKNIAILSSLALIKVKQENITHMYLRHFLDSNLNQNWLKRLMGGSALQRIILRDIRKLTICLPPFPEQQKIAEILSEANNKIAEEESHKKQLEELKRGLMQQLLTGKKRVKV